MRSAFLSAPNDFNKIIAQKMVNIIMNYAYRIEIVITL